VATAGLLAAGLLLTGCSHGGLGLAQQACAHVNRSISLYQRSLKNPDPAKAAAERRAAQEQLTVALPLAAAANSNDGTWNGLMTTIGEGNRVAEAELVDALRSQCKAVANAANNVPPTVPGPTTPSTPTGPTVPGTNPGALAPTTPNRG
jgi:hypothetical protein